MKTEIIVKEKQYLKIGLEQFIQKGQPIYLAKIKAIDFLQIYTVRPAEYDLSKNTSLATSFPDDKEYYEYLINNDEEVIKVKNFQREPDFERISNIRKYITSSEIAFFPNTIIATCDLINDNEKFEINEDNSELEFFDLPNKPNTLCFLKKENESYFLFVPYLTNSVLIIDGQHRLEGLKKVDSSILVNYDLIIAFIIGYDRSIIAKQFYTINYEQKPVNKSLLYQLTGEFSKEVNELSFMHNVVKLLNELNESPFFGRVKMLGRAPKNLSTTEKNRLSISQAFLIDSLIRFISRKGKGTSFPPIMLNFFVNPSDHIFIVRALSRYFNAVKKIKPEWDSPDTSIISKGMGVAALLRVFNIIYLKIIKDYLNNDLKRIKDLRIEDFELFLKGLEKVDFTTNGPFGKVGSSGSVTKIKNEILDNLDLIQIPKNQVFSEIEFKKEYVENFNNLISEI